MGTGDLLRGGSFSLSEAKVEVSLILWTQDSDDLEGFTVTAFQEVPSTDVFATVLDGEDDRDLADLTGSRLK